MVTHAFTSGKSDGTDATIVQPSNWNAGHTVSYGTPGSSMVADAVAAGSATSVARSDHVHGREDMAQTDASPAADETVQAGFSAIVMGLPYVIASGHVTLIDTGAVLSILP